MRYTFLILFTLLISCEPKNSLIDLTPDDGFNSSWYFHSPDFNKALEKIEPTDKDTIYQIEKPEGLINRNPFLDSIKWYTTDTFAFERQDFDVVLNTIHATVDSANAQTAYPSPKLSWIQLGNIGAYSKASEYWLVPNWKNNKRYFIQISREKVGGSGWFSTYKYTANGLWMTGKRKIIDGDVS